MWTAPLPEKPVRSRRSMQRYRRVEQGPMREAVCAENNAKFFDFEVEPIPQSDKPDF